MDMTAVNRRLADQAGVISRGQLLAAGGGSGDVARMLRRREWVRLLPGIYLNHTGDPTWLQRAWAGVLFHEPAALAGRSALRALVGPSWRRYDDSGPIELAVPQPRHVEPQPGYLISRPADFLDRVQWTASPPRLRPEQAGLDVAMEADSQFELIAVLADLCQTRRTTPARLLAALAKRGRARHRSMLKATLQDIADGTCSVLEHGYLDRVERPHGLPIGHRQVFAELARPSFRDVEYDIGLVVELDGRLFHDTARQRDLDLDRDLATAADGKDTVRLGWGQVFERPCWTADRIATLLVRRGWRDHASPCGPTCPVSSLDTRSA